MEFEVLYAGGVGGEEGEGGGGGGERGGRGWVMRMCTNKVLYICVGPACYGVGGFVMYVCAMCDDPTRKRSVDLKHKSRWTPTGMGCYYTPLNSGHEKSRSRPP